MITYLLPTHNRPQVLAQTLAALRGHVDDLREPAEVIVLDNAATPEAAATVEDTVGSDARFRTITLDRNRGAAARNVGAHAARGDWLVMLDDDSHPLGIGHERILAGAESDVAAIGADIVLPDGRREAGGLPEVIVGCGAAIRRDAFLEVGGYDPAFGFYVEEYDLCARLLHAGWRVVHDVRFRVRHRKVAAGRDMNSILARLVRNGGWVVERHVPAPRRDAARAELLTRYARIALREGAGTGYARGVAELLATAGAQVRRPLPARCDDRFTGLAAVRRALADDPRLAGGPEVAVVAAGKHASVVRRVLVEDLGATLVDDARRGAALVVGTLSPGPMLDAAARHRDDGRPVILPWHPRGVERCGLAA